MMQKIIILVDSFPNKNKSKIKILQSHNTKINFMLEKFIKKKVLFIGI